jgi:two-component system, cell cycle sensor histidine kinase and response regulator CckA
MDDFSWRKRKILVVEDDAPVRDLLVRVLQDAGYLVLGARNGVEALELAAQQAQIDLLITDLVMRGMNGIEIAQKLSEDRPSLPVLITSSYTLAQLGHEEMPIVAEFVEKPWVPTELLERVARILQ